MGNFCNDYHYPFLSYIEPAMNSQEYTLKSVSLPRIREHPLQPIATTLPPRHRPNREWHTNKKPNLFRVKKITPEGSLAPILLDRLATKKETKRTTA